jgi:hypothetical protein
MTAPIARCPANGVEAFSFPFFIARGKGMGTDFIFLDFHFWEMTDEEKKDLGELVEVAGEEELIRLGYPRDDLGVFVVGVGEG